MKKILAACFLSFFSLPLLVAQELPGKIDAMINSYVQLNKFNGSLLVASHGKIILEKGYGLKDAGTGAPNDVNTIFQAGSITKTFTAAVVLKLIEQHQLSLDDKLSKFYPDFPKGDSIRIENLLTHTSGIYDYTHEPDFIATSLLPTTEEHMLALLKQKPFTFSPGSKYGYSNSGYVLLGYIIEKVTHLPYEQAVRKMIFVPLGMHQSGFDYKGLQSKDKETGYLRFSVLEKKEYPAIDSSEYTAAGSLYSTVGDLYKWHQALQSGRVMNPSSLKAAYQPFKEKYGYGWALDSIYHQKTVGHTGGMFGFRALLTRIPEDDVCIILLNNSSDDPYLDIISKTILAILYSQPYDLPELPVKLKDQELEKYTGTYQMAPDNLVDVILEDGHLMGRSPRKTLELLPRAVDRFYVMDKEGEKGDVEFERNAAGAVSEIHLIKPDNSRKVGKKIK
jgi:CubicO group peptidase (beta-lactamase class C family)